MKISECLYKQYKISTDSKMIRLSKGHDSKNYLIKDNSRKYILKRYDNLTKERVLEIHNSINFFYKAGIPAIAPIVNDNETDYFEYRNMLYALFPYIDGYEIKNKNLNDTNIASMGKILGKMHKIAHDSSTNFMHTKKIRIFNVNDFNQQSQSLLTFIQNKDTKNDLDLMNIDTLNSKICYINTHKDEISDINTPNDIILTHKDFHEQNILFDKHGEVYKIFDFDKSCNDSKCIEICRTILFVCTTGRFNRTNFKRIEMFLKYYLQESSLDINDMRNALKFYIFDYMFGKWILDQYYYKGNRRVAEFMQNQHDTQIYMCKNLDKFINRVISYI